MIAFGILLSPLAQFSFNLKAIKMLFFAKTKDQKLLRKGM